MLFSKTNKIMLNHSDHFIVVCPEIPSINQKWEWVCTGLPAESLRGRQVNVGWWTFLSIWVEECELWMWSYLTRIYHDRIYLVEKNALKHSEETEHGAGAWRWYRFDTVIKQGWKIQEIHENPWTSMKIHEHPWKPMKTLNIHENPWQSKKNPWKNMNIHEHGFDKPWKTMKNHETSFQMVSHYLEAARTRREGAPKAESGDPCRKGHEMLYDGLYKYIHIVCIIY